MIWLKTPKTLPTILNSIQSCPDGTRISTSGPKERLKTNPQTDRFHAMVRDVARALPEYGGLLMDEDSWKDVFLDALFDGRTRMVPKLNRMGMMPLSPHWKALTIKEAMDAITIVQAFGDQHGVHFKGDDILEESYGCTNR